MKPSYLKSVVSAGKIEVVCGKHYFFGLGHVKPCLDASLTNASEIQRYDTRQRENIQ